MPKNILIHSALFLITFLGGANFTIARFALPEYIQPFGFISLRALAGIIFFTLAWQLKTDEKVAKNDYWMLALCGVFGVAINQMAFFYGLSLTTPINAAVITTISPIIVFVLAYLLGREKLTSLKIIGLIIGALGTYFFITKEGTFRASNKLTGDIFILVASTGYAIYLVMLKPLMKKYKPITIIKWVFIFGGFIAVPAGLGQMMQVQWQALPGKAVFALAYVVLLATVFVYLLNAWTLRYVESSVVGAYIYLQPVLATIVAVGLHEDTLEWREVFYSLIILTGVYLVSKKEKHKQL